MVVTKMNSDLVKERSSATFDVLKLAAVLYGGEANVKRRTQLADLVEVRRNEKIHLK
jgi:hypothetical protein